MTMATVQRYRVGDLRCFTSVDKKMHTIMSPTKLFLKTCWNRPQSSRYLKRNALTSATRRLSGSKYISVNTVDHWHCIDNHLRYHLYPETSIYQFARTTKTFTASKQRYYHAVYITRHKYNVTFSSATFSLSVVWTVWILAISNFHPYDIAARKTIFSSRLFRIDSSFVTHRIVRKLSLPISPRLSMLLYSTS